MGLEAGGGARGSFILGGAGDLKLNGVGDAEGLKVTSRGGAEELDVGGGGRGRMSGHTGDTGNSGDTENSELGRTSGNRRLKRYCLLKYLQQILQIISRGHVINTQWRGCGPPCLRTPLTLPR